MEKLSKPNSKKKQKNPVYAKGYGTGKKVSSKQVLRCLYKWLKIIFQYYDELKSRIDEQDKRIEELENTTRLIREKLESIDNGEVN